MARYSAVYVYCIECYKGRLTTYKEEREKDV